MATKDGSDESKLLNYEKGFSFLEISLPQEFQVYFKVRGLVAPKDKLVFNDRLLFRRPLHWEKEGDDVCEVFF